MIVSICVVSKKHKHRQNRLLNLDFYLKIHVVKQYLPISTNATILIKLHYKLINMKLIQ